RYAKQGESLRLIEFLEKVCFRFPETVQLWKLWHYSACDIGDTDSAALAAIGYLEAGCDPAEARRWLARLIPRLKSRNEKLLEAIERVPGQWGLEYKAILLVIFRDLPAALATYAELRALPGPKPETDWADLGDILYARELHAAAEQMYWRAIEESPDQPELIRRFVENQLEWGRKFNSEKIFEAQQVVERLYERFPDEPEAWFAMGLFWRTNSRPERAFPFLMKYFQEVPDCRWRSGFTFDLAYLEDLTEEAAFELRRSWSSQFKQMTRAEGPPLHTDRDPDRKLRIGYVSPDLGRHPVGYFAKTVLMAHDRDAFEVFLYSQRDPVSQHDAVSREFCEWAGEAHWRWVRNLDNIALLRQVREDRIDILVDLAGHSSENRLDVFCNRGAPVQVTWLGAPATTGIPEIDYRFSDAIVEPEGAADELSSERIWRLPNGFHAINLPEGLPEPAPPPMLTNGYITFGSFNNAKKISSRTISLWARLLREIPQARMLLKHLTMTDFVNRESFRSLFVLEGVDPERILFQGTTPAREDHFAHYARLDVALDPLPYNGTTTTCEALYMGVPVLTLKGSNHASRVSASLLHRLGMDGWVAEDEDRFVRIAKAAAARPDALAARRARLRQTFLSSPLADGPAMARDIEAAYREMWQAKCAEGSSNTHQN
ncbi:MAG: hypothetical protein ACLFU4_09310, partial [Opitutales bacterium]